MNQYTQTPGDVSPRLHDGNGNPVRRLPAAAVQVIAGQIGVILAVAGDGLDLEWTRLPVQRQVMAKHLGGFLTQIVQVELVHPVIRL